MEKRLMLEQLINYFTDGNKAKFASMIGIKPQLVSTWLSRGTYDAEVLYAGCKDVSGDWLLSGEGEMMKGKQNDIPNTSLDNSERDFYRSQIEFLNKQVQSLSERNKMLEEELVQQLREKKVNVG